MTYVEEAVGIVRAARDHGMPVAISFTVETDGVLPSGSSLESAVEVTDALTGGYPAYYMVNCAHPLHFTSAVAGDAPWLERIRGIRANASTKSHAELDEATELDAGDPTDLGLPLPRAARTSAAPVDHRRLLRHGPPAHAGDVRGMPPGTSARLSGEASRALIEGRPRRIVGGKKASIASSESVTSTGVPNIVVVLKKRGSPVRREPEGHDDGAARDRGDTLPGRACRGGISSQFIRKLA